jgi:hypothetical protein
MKVTAPGLRAVQSQREREKPGGVEMEAFNMTLGQCSHLALLVGVSLCVMVANVAFSVLYMVVYGYWIDPGHDNKYYQDHIQIAAPYCGIIAGIPLMFAVGWVVSGWKRIKFAIKSAIIVWLAYTLIDLAILLAAGISFRILAFFVTSIGTQLAAVYFGATYRIRRDSRSLDRAQPG